MDIVRIVTRAKASILIALAAYMVLALAAYCVFSPFASGRYEFDSDGHLTSRYGFPNVNVWVTFHPMALPVWIFGVVAGVYATRQYYRVLRDSSKAKAVRCYAFACLIASCVMFAASFLALAIIPVLFLLAR